MPKKIKGFNGVLGTILISSAFVFSFWLMFHTFRYKDGTMFIATKVWSDFASHIPLIRSFSLGGNLPPQHPLFAEEPIRYHFLFYLLVGILEKIGFPIDFALNFPSALSFFLLILIIFFLAKYLFGDKLTGFLSVVFFLFNGSFSFFEFFKNHPLSANTIHEIVKNTQYPSFAPYGQGIVSAFWNLNIYTNQRHLALSLFVLLLITLIVIRKEKKGNLVLTTGFGGLITGILFYLHSSVFVMALIVLGMFFILLPNKRKEIFLILTIAFIFSFPRLIVLKETSSFSPQLRIGYLVPDKVTLASFLNYWFMNLGLLLVLTPVGFLISPPTAKKVWVAYLPLFIVGNLVQFSPEMAANHKFFNAFVIVNNMFAGWAIIWMWRKVSLARPLLVIVFVLLIFSGIIDFFPLKNDSIAAINDYPKDARVEWIIKNTSKNSVFLNSSYIYHPASIAGRPIFLGWPYFVWSAGHDTSPRQNFMRVIYESHDKQDICNQLTSSKIDYFTVEDTGNDLDRPRIDVKFFKENFIPSYIDKKSDFLIFQVKLNCSKTSI